jgi:hypothetical protein
MKAPAIRQRPVRSKHHLYGVVAVAEETTVIDVPGSATNITVRVTTKSGTNQFPGMQVETYTVTVKLAGFKTQFCAYSCRKRQFSMNLVIRWG